MTQPTPPIELASDNQPATSLSKLGIFTKLRLRRGKNQLSVANRRHARHACSCVGVVSIANRSISLDGIVSEISLSGIKFRPAKRHLLERKDVQVSIDFAGFHVIGKIAATRPDGYGIALFDEFEEEQINRILNMDTEIFNSFQNTENLS